MSIGHVIEVVNDTVCRSYYSIQNSTKYPAFFEDLCSSILSLVGVITLVDITVQLVNSIISCALPKRWKTQIKDKLTSNMQLC